MAAIALATADLSRQSCLPSPPAVRLIAIEPQPDEFDAWQAYQAREYSREKVASGAWSAESALARAETENAALLPNGFAITGHHIRRIEDKATQELIGWIWVSLAGDTRRASCRSCSDGRNGTFRRKRNLGPALPRGDSRARRNRPASNAPSQPRSPPCPKEPRSS